MSDPCKKSASILLKIQGKTTQFLLYDFAQFSGQNEDAGLYRAKINGRWHCPDGKYTALSREATAEMVCGLLDGNEYSQQPRPEGFDKPIRVLAHWEDPEPGCGRAWTKTPPHLGSDGRWWIWIDGPRMVRCDDVRILDCNKRK